MSGSVVGVAGRHGGPIEASMVAEGDRILLGGRGVKLQHNFQGQAKETRRKIASLYERQNLIFI